MDWLGSAPFLTRERGFLFEIRHSLWIEVGQVQQMLNAITEKYSGGDINSIVREFLRAKLK